MNKPFIVANVREILDLYDKEEISFSRMVELFNFKAFAFHQQELSKEREKAKKLVEALKKIDELNLSFHGTPLIGSIEKIIKQSLTGYEKL